MAHKSDSREKNVLAAKHIVHRTKSSLWFGCDYNMNIYRGCSHGCIYCDSRSACYREENFDRVKIKDDAIRLLTSDLRHLRKRGVIATGAMSDPYNPLESVKELTRQALTVINSIGFGVAITTKSPLVTRDLDLLSEIAARYPVIVKLTITTDDDALASRIEPLARSSSARFGALRELSDRGIFCGVLMMPLLPFINDSLDNIVGLVRAAAVSGAKFIYPLFGLTIRAGQREYLYNAFDSHFPGMRARYEEAFGDSYRCLSPNAEQLEQIFRQQCDRFRLLYDMEAIVDAYRSRREGRQKTLF